MKRQLIGYLRVSTDEQEVSGNGLAAQRAAIIRFAEDNDCEILEFVEEALSAKLGIEDRPVLKAAMAKCLKMKATLCVSKLDRLSRHASFILNLMDRSLRFVVVQFGFDADEFMIHMYAVLGEKERKMIGQRTKDALAVLSRQGVELGYAKHKDSAIIVAARAMGASKNANKADEFAAKMRPTIERMRNCGMSFSAIARELNETGAKTARGGEWAAMTVSNLVARWGTTENKEAA